LSFWTLFGQADSLTGQLRKCCEHSLSATMAKSALNSIHSISRISVKEGSIYVGDATSGVYVFEFLRNENRLHLLSDDGGFKNPRHVTGEMNKIEEP